MTPSNFKMKISQIYLIKKNKNNKKKRGKEKIQIKKISAYCSFRFFFSYFILISYFDLVYFLCFAFAIHLRTAA